MVILEVTHNKQAIERAKKQLEEGIRPTGVVIKYLLVKSYKEAMINLLGEYKSSLEGVQSLVVVNCNISKQELDVMMDYLPCTNLIHMDLSSNHKGLTDQVIKQVLMRCGSLTSLCLRNNNKISDNILDQLDPWQQLQCLQLDNTGISDDGLAMLFKNTSMANIKTLGLSKNSRISSLCFIQYIGAPISHLDVSTCRLTNAALALLQRHPINETLIKLDLSYNQSNEPMDINILLGGDTPCFGLLQYLSLRKLYMTQEMVVTLLHCKHLVSICSLDLSENRLGDQLFKQIHEQSLLKQINSLYLNDTKISYKTIKYMAKIKTGRLQVLDVGNNILVRDQGLIYLESLMENNPIKRLVLCKCNISEVGASILAGMSSLQKVEHLNLRGNNYIQDEGAKSILGSNNIINLRFMSMSNCWLTSESMGSLVESICRGVLQDLRMSENNLGADALTMLAQNVEYFPALKLFAGGYYCNEEFPGQNKFQAREIEVHSYIGDDLD